jgi:hypothetical protein
MKNLGTVDRVLRIIVAEICLLIGFFWVGMEWQIMAYLLAVVLTVQAVTGICGLYKLMGIDTCERVKHKKKGLTNAVLATVVIIALVGGYVSITLTKQAFTGDFYGLKKTYDTALQDTGKGLKEQSVSDYGALQSSLKNFTSRYSTYLPLVVKFDNNFTMDVQEISAAVEGSNADVSSGNLTAAHEKLGMAEPIFQGMINRYGLDD